MQAERIASTPVAFPVEVEILASVYYAAKKRSDAEREELKLSGQEPMQNMAYWGRRALLLLLDIPDDPALAERLRTLPPANRGAAKRRTFRFSMNSRQYASVVRTLHVAQVEAMAALAPGVSKEMGKRSVARWIEFHFDLYAKTGAMRPEGNPGE